MTVNRFAKVLTFALFLGVAATALPAGITGKWIGRFDARLAPSTSGGTPPPTEQIKAMNEILSKIRIVLTIKADGTYVAVTKGPDTTAPKQPDATTKGTWKLKGKTLTLTPGDKGAGEVGTVSGNFKSLTMSLPPLMVKEGVKGHAVFTKG